MISALDSVKAHEIVPNQRDRFPNSPPFAVSYSLTPPTLGFIALIKYVRYIYNLLL